MSHDKNNEFEPIQSDAAMRTMMQSLNDEIQAVKSTMQSAQDSYAKFQETLTSDSFKKILNVIDTGTDEAEAGTVVGESGARSLARTAGNLTLFNNFGESTGNRLEMGGVRANNFAMASSDDRFWINMLRLKASAGEVDPDSIVALAKIMNLGKDE